MENKPYGVVYMIVNLVNGKRYVGQTKQRLSTRYNSHINGNESSGISAIHLAIKKYGKENFLIGIIEEADSPENLNILEGVMIAKYKSHYNEWGYNINKVENGIKITTEETKRKMSETKKQEKYIKIAAKNGESMRGRKTRKDAISKYIGVRKKENRFAAWIQDKNKNIYLGTYITEKEAAMSRDIAIINKYGIDSKLNFPELIPGYLDGSILPQRTTRKYNGSIKGVYYHSKNKMWAVKLSGFNDKFFENKIDAENYARKILES